MKLATFKRGGIHVPEHKYTANYPIVSLPLPEKVFIPVVQHIGAPAEIKVKKGEEVKTGQLLAEGKAFISAHVHSSVTGKVLKISKMTDTSGYPHDVIEIEVYKEDVWAEDISFHQKYEDVSLSPQEIISRVRNAGIVGLGGATFPTHVKLNVPSGKKIDLLIINGAECEPYLTADHRLMVEHAQEIIRGTQFLMKALGVKRSIIGIENNKPDAIIELQKYVSSDPSIDVVPLKARYPQGGEKQLIQALTGREVPSGKLPLDVGVVVNNVGTAYAVYEAVLFNKPLIERIVTLTGDGVKKPGNFRVRIGTPVEFLLNYAGGLPENTGKIISGGPMMGRTLTHLQVPIVKGTSGILLLSSEKSYRKKAENCIRCAQCVQVCPMQLEPYYLAQLSRAEFLEELEKNRVMDCIECGSCMYICPSYRPLLDFIRLGKIKTGQMLRARKN